MKKKILSLVTVILLIYSVLVIIFGIFGFLGKSYISDDPLSDNIADIKSNYDKNKKIKLKRGNEIKELSLLEYLYGVVSAEMPASFHEEALKAQAVAARTYTISKMNKNIPEHGDADVCDNINHCKAYISEDELTEKYGESWMKEHYPKIKNAVLETDGIIATYSGEPINAVFHSTSSGMTENSKDVWSGDVPYLVSVVSEGEEESPRFNDSVKFSKDEFIKKISQSGKNPTFSDDISSWIGEIIKNESGSIKTIKIGGVNFKGTEVRELLGLRSTNFEIALGEKITVNTKGNGHGVGMSQYGANYMAKHGYTYQQILKKYYTGINIVKCD